MAINPDVTYEDLQRLSDHEYGEFYQELKKLGKEDQEALLKKIEDSTPEAEVVSSLD